MITGEWSSIRWPAADSGGAGDLRGGSVMAGFGTPRGGPASGSDHQVAILRAPSLDGALQP